jgi:hypothetical protein
MVPNLPKTRLKRRTLIISSLFFFVLVFVGVYFYLNVQGEISSPEKTQDSASSDAQSRSSVIPVDTKAIVLAPENETLVSQKERVAQLEMPVKQPLNMQVKPMIAADFCQKIAEVGVDEKGLEALKKQMENDDKKIDLEFEQLLIHATKSNDPKHKAVALAYITQHYYWKATRDEFEKEECNADLTCDAQSKNRYLALRKEHSDTLINMARYGNDPQVYAVAYMHCLNGNVKGLCVDLTPYRWTELDPNNGYAWMALNSDYLSKNTPIYSIQIDSVLSSMAQAKKFSIGAETFSRFIAAPEFQNIDFRLSTQFDVLFYSVMGLPSHIDNRSLQKVCAPESPAERQKVCMTILDNYKEGANSMIDLAMVQVLAKKMNVPATQMQALENEKQAFRWLQKKLLMPTESDEKNLYQACLDNFQMQNEFREIIKTGEVDYYRKKIAQQSLSVAELVALELEGRKKEEDKAKKKKSSSN